MSAVKQLEINIKIKKYFIRVYNILINNYVYKLFSKKCIKLKLKDFILLGWCCFLIILGSYVLRVIILERGHAWKNINEYKLEEGKYNLNEKKISINKPNILYIQFSKLETFHGEISITGGISVSFYEPEKYFPNSGSKKNVIYLR